MGNENYEVKLEGRVSKIADNMYNLYTDEITDVKTLTKYNCTETDIRDVKVSSVTFRLFDIGGAVKFDTLDIEFDGIVMGGCNVNEDCTYNAILMVCYGNKFGAYNYGANKDLKKHKPDLIDKVCQHMHYLPLRDMSIPVKSKNQ